MKASDFPFLSATIYSKFVFQVISLLGQFLKCIFPLIDGRSTSLNDFPHAAANIKGIKQFALISKLMKTSNYKIQRKDYIVTETVSTKLIFVRYVT